MNNKWITFGLAIIISVSVYWFFDLDHEIKLGLSILLGIATLWITETFPITITALLVPVLTVVSGIFSVPDALQNFAHPIIFLFLGGFALAATLRKQGLDTRIANIVIRIAKGRMAMATILIFCTTAFLSMWISNTATTAMMLPLALGLLSRMPYKEHKSTYWFVLLGIAYSANIGGMGTLVGSPPNAIAAAIVGLSFSDWIVFGLPTVVLVFPIVLTILWWMLRPELNYKFESEGQVGPMHRGQWLTLIVFATTVGLWLLSKPLSEWLQIETGFDSMVAIMALVMVSALRLVSWKDIQKSVNWGVLLLFGGGLTLSAMLKVTNTSPFLAESIIHLMEGAPLFVFLLVIVAFVVMLTEVASNTASSALLIPIFVSVAEAMGLSTVTLAAVIAISASCAFMLPVATPPNAIVFGSGYLPQQQMMRVGVVVNFSMIALISTEAWLLL